MDHYKTLLTSFVLITNFLHADSNFGSEKDRLDVLAKEIEKIEKASINRENRISSLAQEVKSLTTQELDELGKMIATRDTHQHINVSSPNPTLVKKQNSDEKKKIKMKEILTALGALAAKEGTDSACTFCSAILKDVTVNKVEIVDMAQDWVELRIKKGNTLSHFAKNYYGNANAYKAIYELNRETIDSNYTTYTGNIIKIPRVETLEKQKKRKALSCKFCAALLSDASLKRIEVLKVNKDSIEVKVVRGDSLSTLAYKYYGKASQYMKIYEANIGKIGNNYLIYPNDILTIPHPK